MTQDATTADALREANKFDISGPIAISYSTTSLDGKPQLSYRDAEGERRFTDGDIGRVEDAALGAFVTVVLEAQAENFVRSFTLAVPAVLGELGSETPFSTFGFETIAIETIAGPPSGVQHTYRTYQLDGVAKVVEFL
jgi:hypothetical protein